MGQQELVACVVVGVVIVGVAVWAAWQADSRTGDRAPSDVRALGALLTLLVTGGTGFVGLVLAWIMAYGNCQDGCRPGSPFALGAWGTRVELWYLYVPGLVMAAFVLAAIAAGWRRGAQAAWIIMTALFVAWSTFTLVITASLGLLGLLVCCGGALCGLRIAFPGAFRTGRAARPRRS